MNKLVHDIMNKFNNITIMCGTLALELESKSPSSTDPSYFRKRAEELSRHLEEDLIRSRQLLIEITNIISEKLNCYEENEHFFKEIEPNLSIMESKRLELEDIVNKNETSLPITNIIEISHALEEKAQACGKTMKELRSSLIEAGKYQPKK